MLHDVSHLNFGRLWSIWVVELAGNEIVPYSNRKRKPEHVIAQSCKNKCAKLQVELKEANKKLKDVTNQMHLLENSMQLKDLHSKVEP